MSTRKVWLVSLTGLVTAVGLLVAAFYASAEWIERLRVADAAAAFGPLESLGCDIFSQPIAFHRHCHYIVEFPPTSRLSDTNIASLNSLNKLPTGNFLDLVIRSLQVTDASLPELAALAELEALDVTQSGVSDAGIAELNRRLPRTIVVERKQR